MLILRRLLWVLRHPVPVPWGWVAFAGTVLTVWALGTWLQAAFDVTARLAIGAGFVAVLVPGLEARVAAARLRVKDPVPMRIALIAVGVSACVMFVALIRAVDLPAVQRAVTWIYLFLAGVGFYRYRLIGADEGYARQMEGVTQPVAVLNTQLRVLTLVALAVLNLWTIPMLTPEVWLIVFALAPLALHPLVCWTMIAMWPWEEE